ncbi:MAG: hypothetical protein GX091_04690, partial [Peptococcaceae bacterium]|nr:hypothetical protein [Peptococcaceae bacterium]
VKYLITVLIMTFFIAAFLGSGTEAVFRYLPLSLAWMLLIIVIAVGIIFDVLGVAAAAADEAPHNARAARKVFGAKQSVYLIKHADRVSNFACDIIGDITGTLSGAIGATIIMNLISSYPSLSEWEILLNVLILAVIASCTVTGKAWAKTFALNEANSILDLTGRIVAWLEKVTRLNLTGAAKRGGK